MDIRNFFKPPATPATGPGANQKAAPTAKKELVTSPITITPAPKKKVPQKRKLASSAARSDAELKKAKKIVAAAAKAKKKKKEDNFYCPPELLEWSKVRQLYIFLPSFLPSFLLSF